MAHPVQFGDRRDNTHISFFYNDLKPYSVGQVDLVFDKGSLVGLRVKDYKSLCAAVTICSTLVNIETHTQTRRQYLASLFDKLSSASWAKTVLKPEV